MKTKQSLDQLDRVVEFNFPPQRIISLVPSQTELLSDLGVGERVVGVTKFCVHPKSWHNNKTKIGGTKNFNFEAIDALHPDLILGNKEENYEAGIRQLSTRYPVWMSDITGWDSAMKMIVAVGEMVGAQEEARGLVNDIEHRFENAKVFSPARTLYLIWKTPWMAAGRNTFIDTLLTRIGLKNTLNAERYPELSPDEIRSLAPEIVLLPSEPFPFQQKHADELRDLLPTAKIILVDGEMFSWYGSRLLRAPAYFSSLEL